MTVGLNTGYSTPSLDTIKLIVHVFFFLHYKMLVLCEELCYCVWYQFCSVTIYWWISTFVLFGLSLAYFIYHFCFGLVQLRINIFKDEELLLLGFIILRVIHSFIKERLNYSINRDLVGS